MTNNNKRSATVLTARLSVAPEDNSGRSSPADTDLRQRRELLYSFISAHGGHEFSIESETTHAEFPAELDAIRCAQAIVEAMQARPGGGRLAMGGIGVGIGIAFGDLQNDGETISGNALDSANKMCALARANEIVVSDVVREKTAKRFDLSFQEYQPAPGQTLAVPAHILVDDNSGKSGFAFVRELVRRRVFRAAGAYVVVSWILVQAASIVFPEFNAPRWAMRALIVLLTAGFPLAVLLAWTVDFTARGLKQTPDSAYSRTRGGVLRFSIVGISTVLSAVVLWWVWTGYLEPTTQRPTRAEIKEDPVVAVDTPRKIAGGDDIGWLGEGVANLLRDELAESPQVIVLSQSRWSEIAAKADTPEELRTIALDVGIDYLVEGDYLQSPDGLVFSVRVEDLENGTQIQSTRQDKDDAAGVIAATSEIAVGIKRALNIPHESNVSRFAADFAVQNMDAYEAYIAGLAYFVNFDYQLAEQSFDAALELAPDYHMARYRRAMVMQSTGRSDLALRELKSIPDNADLTERERLYIEGAKAHFTAEQDPARSIEIYEQLVNLYPYENEARQHLANSYWLDYQEDAAITEFRRLAELHAYDPSAWMALGERLLDVGQLDEAEQALQNYVKLSPDDHFALALLGNLEQLRGRYPKSIAFYDQALEMKADFAVALIGLARSRYMEGEIKSAESLWSQLISDDDQAAGYRIDAAFDLAGVLRGQDRLGEASAPLQQVADIVRQEGPRTAMMLSTLGLTAVELGDFERATALVNQAIDASPGTPTRYLFARGILELNLGQHEQLQNTAAEIKALALPPDNPDRTEEKAAGFLLGMSNLQQGDHKSAAAMLETAHNMDGYSYALYDLGLAQLKLATGELENAAAIAERAMTARDPGDLRLDLELERARAKRLHAQIVSRIDSDSSSDAD